MFICMECARRRLSKQGKKWPFPESYGSCEICNKTAICKDVSSQWDWPWKTKKNQQQKKGQ